MSIIDVYGYNPDLQMKPNWYCFIEGRHIGDPIPHDVVTLAFTLFNINRLLNDIDPVRRDDSAIKWVIHQCDMLDFATMIRGSGLLPQLHDVAGLAVEDQSKLKLVQRVGYTFLEASKPFLKASTFMSTVVADEEGLVVPALCLRKVLP